MSTFSVSNIVAENVRQSVEDAAKKFLEGLSDLADGVPISLVMVAASKSKGGFYLNEGMPAEIRLQ